MRHNCQLGLGLIGIGRPWGHVASAVPSEKETLAFLEFAFELGIRFFDTAPSYGLSEARLGKFLRTLGPEERRRVTVATKFGDHWDAQAQAAYVDHSYGALCASLDRSLERLGPIDLLQLHKTTPEVLTSEALARAYDYARQRVVPVFGASISDPVSGEAVCTSTIYDYVQLPYNTANQAFDKVIDLARHRRKQVLINRPFKMGELLSATKTHDLQEVRITAFEFILQKPFRGVVLTGTKSRTHFLENWTAFNEACNRVA